MNKRVLINYYAKLLQKGYDESKIPEDLLEDVKKTYKELPPREFDPVTETPAADALESSKEVKEVNTTEEASTEDKKEDKKVEVKEVEIISEETDKESDNEDIKEDPVVEIKENKE